MKRVFGRDFDLFLRFQIDQRSRTAPELRPIDLFGVEDVEQDHFITVEAKRLDGLDDGVRRFVKVRDDDHHAALPKEILKVQERFGEVRASTGFGMFAPCWQTEKLSYPRVDLM